MLKTYQQNEQAAHMLLSVGVSQIPKNINVAELAAWTNVASLILNLDEVITRE